MLDFDLADLNLLGAEMLGDSAENQASLRAGHELAQRLQGDSPLRSTFLSGVRNGLGWPSSALSGRASGSERRAYDLGEQIGREARMSGQPDRLTAPGILGEKDIDPALGDAFDQGWALGLRKAPLPGLEQDPGRPWMYQARMAGAYCAYDARDLVLGTALFLASGVGMAVGGGAGALLWTGHRILGLLVGALLGGTAGGVGMGHLLRRAL